MSLQESTVKMKDYFTTKHNMISILVLILDADHNLEQLSWPPAVPELSFAQAPGPGASHCRILGKWHDLQKPVLTSHTEEWASPYDSLTWEIFTMLSIPQIHSLLGTQHQQGAVHAIPIWLQSRAVVTFQTRFSPLFSFIVTAPLLPGLSPRGRLWLACGSLG